MNLVSIIIPVYNGEKYIEEAISSAKSQSYKNIEIIIVNDGSTDNTHDICKSIEGIRYYYKENGGVSSALNYGIKKMKGEYFSWLSHDDLYYNNKIKEQLDILEKYNYKYKAIYGKANFINSKGQIIKKNKERKVKIMSFVDFYKETSYKAPNGCSFLLHKNLINSVGYFNEEFKFIQDIDYWKRIALKGYDIIKSNKIYVKTRIHSEQSTISLKKRHKTELTQLYINQFAKIMSNYMCKSIAQYFFFSMAITGHYKLRRKLFINYTSENKVSSLFKAKAYLLTCFGFKLFKLKKLKRYFVNLKHRN